MAKIEDIEKKIEELKQKKKELIQNEKSKERKARTRRLIEMGAIIEKELNLKNKDEVFSLCEYLKKYTDNFEKIKKYIANSTEKLGSCKIAKP